MSKFCRAALALFLTAPTAFAGNWPAWRGLTGQGVTEETELPLKWSSTANVKWKVPLPDEGNSTPVVWSDRLFLTQATDKGAKRTTHCLSTTDGMELWKKTVPFAGKETTHATNPYCSASPTTDGERVVVWHGSAGVFCYDFAGKELWSRDLGKFEHVWGNASSPVIHGGHVLLAAGPGERTFLVALDKTTGKDVWRVEEPGGKAGITKGEAWIGSWSTPVVTRSGDREVILMSWAGVVKAHDPKTGEVIWSCRGLQKDKGTDKLTYTSPLATPEVVVAMAGYGGPAIALRNGGSGDVTDTHRLWRHPTNPQRIGSGVIVGAHIYIVNETGTAQCIEWMTGKTLWTERIGGSGPWGSLVRAGDRLMVTKQDGETVILKADPAECIILARNALGKETTRASIVPADGHLYIRTYKHLWCIGP